METPVSQQEIFEAAKSVLEKLLDLMGLPGKVLPSDEFTVTDDKVRQHRSALTLKVKTWAYLSGAAARPWSLYSTLSG